jgi:DNA invertase Pin-like site-specific DNA recombinase
MAMEILALRSQLTQGRNIYDLPLRVTFYARVSTDTDVQLNSLDNQVFYYENKINGVENWSFVPGYVDEGISGKSAENRASFMRMIRDAKAGKFDLILTKEISRFSRSTLDSIRYTQELLAKGVGVFFESDNIATFDPDSELRLTIMASLAQDELRKLSTRLRFGYEQSIKKGRVLGQSNILGYDKQDGRLTINEQEAAIVRRIFSLYLERRLGVRGIANLLEAEGVVNPSTGKRLSPSTIPNVIRNPKYKGYYCARKTVSIDYRNSKQIRQDKDKWVLYPDPNIPAIVSEEMWDAANRLYEERGAKAKANADAYSVRYPFSGKIICGEHGTSYHRHLYTSKKRGAQEVWNCKRYRQKGKDEGCDSPTLYTQELNGILNDIYKTIYAQRDVVIDGLMNLYQSVGARDYEGDVAKVREQIEGVQRKKDKLLELVMGGYIENEELKVRNERFNAELAELGAALDRVTREREAFRNQADTLASIRRALQREIDNPDHYVAELSTELLDKIIVHKLDGDKHHVRLEIILKMARAYEAEIENDRCISLQEIGISQAQVSRLEKTALGHMRKNI